MQDRRSFIKTFAAAAAGVALGSSLLPRHVLAEPRVIEGCKIDDLPLIGPYQLPTLSPQDSIRLAFRGTDPKTAAAGGVISYGLKSPREKSVKFEAAKKHVIALEGLAPDAQYEYELRLGDYQSPVYRFRTSPPAGKRMALKTAVLMDIHCFSPDEDRSKSFFQRFNYVSDDIRKFAPDILLCGGDLVQLGSIREQYVTFFRILREVCGNALLVTIPGNHEWVYDTDLSIYKDFLPMPENGPAGEKNITWSMGFGGVGFSMRKTESVGNLKDTVSALRKGGADFIIDAQHHPLYQWAKKEKGEEVLTGSKAVCPIFDSERVNLSLVGHRHMHQRTLPISAGKATSTEKSDYGSDTKGTIYMQVPSLWYQFARPLENALVAHNGKPSFTSEYTGYSEMTITPESVATQTFAYSAAGDVRHEKIDEFKLARAK
jgi:hypothetical protein